MDQLTKAIAAVLKASNHTPYAITNGVGLARSQLTRLLSSESSLNTDSIDEMRKTPPATPALAPPVTAQSRTSRRTPARRKRGSWKRL